MRCVIPLLAQHSLDSGELWQAQLGFTPLQERCWSAGLASAWWVSLVLAIPVSSAWEGSEFLCRFGRWSVAVGWWWQLSDSGDQTASQCSSWGQLQRVGMYMGLWCLCFPYWTWIMTWGKERKAAKTQSSVSVLLIQRSLAGALQRLACLLRYLGVPSNQVLCQSPCSGQGGFPHEFLIVIVSVQTSRSWKRGENLGNVFSQGDWYFLSVVFGERETRSHLG